MRAREPRRHVVISSRIRCGATWRDVRILNISSRGLGLHAAGPPELGSYVELRRGPHIIIARVAWVKESRFGVRTQDAVPIDALVNPTACAAVEQQSKSDEWTERRSAPRSRRRDHDSSRILGRAMEFGFLAVLGVSAAVVALATLQEAFGRPLTAVWQALARSGSPG
jgi:hypothetical protein